MSYSKEQLQAIGEKEVARKEKMELTDALRRNRRAFVQARLLEEAEKAGISMESLKAEAEAKYPKDW